MEVYKIKISEKLLRILRSKTQLSDLELSKLNESDGWNIVYSLSGTKKEKLIEICFTGFTPADKNELIKIAEENNFHVAQSVTTNLNFLCCGDNAGPSKMEKAKKQNVQILTKNEFVNLIETGEMPTVRL